MPTIADPIEYALNNVVGNASLKRVIKFTQVGRNRRPTMIELVTEKQQVVEAIRGMESRGFVAAYKRLPTKGHALVLMTRPGFSKAVLSIQYLLFFSGGKEKEPI